MRSLSNAASVIVLALLALLVAVLVRGAWPSIVHSGVSFVTSSEWRANDLDEPARDDNGHIVIVDGETVMRTVPAVFGALPVVWGTLASSVLALLCALPVGLGAALVLARERRRTRLRDAASFLVELLASVPSIAFGMWGLFVLAPIVGRNLLCGALVLAVMVLPILTALARDVLVAQPAGLEEGATALGCTWWESSKLLVVEAKRGLAGAALLAFARAAGETMAVTMVVGNANRFSLSPLEPAQTMSSLLANELAEASGELHRAALLEVALLLLAISLVTNIIARRLVLKKLRA